MAVTLETIRTHNATLVANVHRQRLAASRHYTYMTIQGGASTAGYTLILRGRAVGSADPPLRAQLLAPRVVDDYDYFY